VQAVIELRVYGCLYRAEQAYQQQLIVVVIVVVVGVVVIVVETMRMLQEV
jgi:hypothetical protein